VSNRDGLLPYLQAKIEAQMYSTESPPLNDDYPERDADASDLDAERASSNRVHRLRPGTAYHPSGFKTAQFRSDRSSISRRLTRKLARFFLVSLVSAARWRGSTVTT
jgi:hypothetical protein